MWKNHSRLATQFVIKENVIVLESHIINYVEKAYTREG